MHCAEVSQPMIEVLQPMLKAVYHGGFFDKHATYPLWDLILGTKAPQSDMLPLDHRELYIW